LREAEEELVMSDMMSTNWNREVSRGSMMSRSSRRLSQNNMSGLTTIEDDVNGSFPEEYIPKVSTRPPIKRH
jgi:hypothetical protein